jgi:hypothetical protein
MPSTKRGNFTPNRGNGAAPARIVISAPEGKALAVMMERRHNISSGTEAVLMILSGELKTVLLADEETYALIQWLETADVPPLLKETVKSLVIALGR